MTEGIPTGVPVVVLNRPSSHPGASSVAIDRCVGVCDAVSCLLACGHRRIGFLAFQGVPTDEYIAGYQQAFAKRGLTADERMIVYIPRLTPGADTREVITQCLSKIAEPTALLLPRIDHPSRLLDIVRSTGRNVPEDLSLVVVGGMDAGVEHVNPRLSCVEDPIQLLARMAVELLVSGHVGADAAHVTLASRFVFRQSIRERT